jgi:hypothetical protein
MYKSSEKIGLWETSIPLTTPGTKSEMESGSINRNPGNGKSAYDLVSNAGRKLTIRAQWLPDKLA